jgi:hypothetical protein
MSGCVVTSPNDWRVTPMRNTPDFIASTIALVAIIVLTAWLVSNTTVATPQIVQWETNQEADTE